ncbi:MAG: hypothetical protein EA423_07245 [Phycisphaerales bacterium]|nr:MAG: hypothetical protein EA423_07245 [Phycisphaerales bacterium]
MTYRYIATSVAGFVQQLAVAYINHGYVFYVAGHIPPGSDADAIDRKLMDKYGVAKSRWQRARRKLLGKANVHYLRWGSFWVLLANHGDHRIFQEEKDVLRDVRREPIAFCGYSIGYRLGNDGKGHVSVRIHPTEERWLKLFMVQFGRMATVEEVEAEFARLRFEPYAPVVRQLYGVLRAVNKARKLAGLPPADWKCVRTRRRVVRPFEPEKYRRAA